MGSFVELTLAFTFAADTPAEVLGAFRDWRTGDEAPELPALEDSFGADPFDAGMHLGNYFGDDPLASLSLLQRAAVWRYLMEWSDNAYFPGHAGHRAALGQVRRAVDPDHADAPEGRSDMGAVDNGPARRVGHRGNAGTPAVRRVHPRRGHPAAGAHVAGVQVDEQDGRFGLLWTEAQARALMLLDVLPHELGHHYDSLTTRSGRVGQASRLRPSTRAAPSSRSGRPTSSASSCSSAPCASPMTSPSAPSPSRHSPPRPRRTPSMSGPSW